MVILHDYTHFSDGGSRLCFTLARETGGLLVLGSICSGHPYLARYAGVRVKRLVPHLGHPLFRPCLIAAAFKFGTGFLKQQGVALYSGTYAPLAVLHNPARYNVLYCHTPPRFLYDDYSIFYASLPRAMRAAFSVFCRLLRSQYARAVERMDALVANSLAVAGRINRIFGRKAIVIPPPCELTPAFSAPGQAGATSANAGFYLSMSRLDPLKRVDLVVDAFVDMPGRRLVVASSGPEEGRLRARAAGASNITFTGMLDDGALGEMLRNCIATICVAKDEDFGMCATESLAAGKPVVAAGAGGLKEIISHGRTGLLLSANPATEEIKQAVAAMDAMARGMRTACLERAADFGVQNFAEAMRHVLRHGSTPPQGHTI